MSTNLISERDEAAMVANPFCKSGEVMSAERVSLSDAIGVTVFIISWVNTRIKRAHANSSFSAISLLMSLNAMIFIEVPCILVSDAMTARRTSPRSV